MYSRKRKETRAVLSPPTYPVSTWYNYVWRYSDYTVTKLKSFNVVGIVIVYFYDKKRWVVSVLVSSLKYRWLVGVQWSIYWVFGFTSWNSNPVTALINRLNKMSAAKTLSEFIKGITCLFVNTWSGCTSCSVTWTDIRFACAQTFHRVI